LFAPVRLNHAARSNVRFIPDVVIASEKLMFHMFVRDDDCHYHFGDYYGRVHRKRGFTPWYEPTRSRGYYDPVLGYYSWTSSQKGVDLIDRLHSWGNYFLQTPQARPPRTLSGLDDWITQTADLSGATQSVLGLRLDEVVSSPDGDLNLVRLSDSQLSQTLGVAVKRRSISTSSTLCVRRVVAGFNVASGSRRPSTFN